MELNRDAAEKFRRRSIVRRNRSSDADQNRNADAKDAKSRKEREKIQITNSFERSLANPLYRVDFLLRPLRFRVALRFAALHLPAARLHAKPPRGMMPNAVCRSNRNLTSGS